MTVANTVCSGQRLRRLRVCAASQQSSFLGEGVLPAPPLPLKPTVRQPKSKYKAVFDSQVWFLVCLKKQIHFWVW